MAKTLLYRVLYGAADNTIYGVYKEAIFEDRGAAYTAKKALQDAEDRAQQQAPLYIKNCYKITDAWKAGGWSQQRQALRSMLQNGGL